jgi:hypothetical protein
LLVPPALFPEEIFSRSGIAAVLQGCLPGGAVGRRPRPSIRLLHFSARPMTLSSHEELAARMTASWGGLCGTRVRSTHSSLWVLQRSALWGWSPGLNLPYVGGTGARRSRNILQDEIEALSSGIGDRGLGRGEVQFDLRHGVRPAGPSHQRFDEWCGARLETELPTPCVSLSGSHC